MADRPINKLPAASTVYDSDLFVLDQNGIAKKMTGEMFRKYFLKVAGGHGGVSSIAKVSSAGLVDTYRITYADGTTSEFYVQNGTNAEIDIKYAASTSDWVNNGEWSDRIPTYNAVDKYLWAQITITNGLDITRTEGVVGVYGEDAYESAKKGGFEGTKEEFDKKLAEGLVSEKRIIELIEENAPAPDWIANEGEPGHIRNRTHYANLLDDTFLFGRYDWYDDYSGKYPGLTKCANLGVHPCSAPPGAFSCVIGGNTYVDLPFNVICTISQSDFSCIFAFHVVPLDSGNYEIYAYTTEENIVVLEVVYDLYDIKQVAQLSESFIPNTIARVANVHTPDWNANEGEAGYIQNRPFYDEAGECLLAREFDGNGYLVDAEFCALLYKNRLNATYIVDGKECAFGAREFGGPDSGWSFQIYPITNSATRYVVKAMKSESGIVEEIAITTTGGNFVPGTITIPVEVMIPHKLDAKYLPMDDIAKGVVTTFYINNNDRYLYIDFGCTVKATKADLQKVREKDIKVIFGSTLVSIPLRVSTGYTWGSVTLLNEIDEEDTGYGMAIFKDYYTAEYTE